MVVIHAMSKGDTRYILYVLLETTFYEVHLNIRTKVFYCKKYNRCIIPDDYQDGVYLDNTTAQSFLDHVEKIIYSVLCNHIYGYTMLDCKDEMDMEDYMDFAVNISN